MNLTLISAALVGLMSLCAFSLDIMTSPTKSRWMTLPALIRWQVRITATVMMLRSINLYDLSRRVDDIAGQVNLLGFISTACLSLTVVSLTWYASSKKLPARAWERIRYALETMRHHPNTVPVMLDANEVIDIEHAMGQPATKGTDPWGVIREADRVRSMERHQSARG